MKKSRLLCRHACLRNIAKTLLLMKGVFALILISALHVSASGFSQEAKLSLNLKKAPISTVLKAIERKTDCKFAYANNYFPADKQVDVLVTEAPVSEILSLVLQSTGFTFRKVGKSLFVITNDPAGILIRPITGRVRGVDGAPLEGVTVAVKNSATQTATDNNGEFRLDVPDDAVLVFTSVGYQEYSIEVGNRIRIEVVLELTDRELGEVVVVGYGSQKKRDLTGSVASIKDDVVKNRPVANLTEALTGQLAGVDVALSDATPGGETAIKIRGISSISAGNEPLYVVDGYPTTQAFANSILPANIESVDVLKDASATAIYGSRGSNGVIIITTKSGKTGKAAVNLNILNGQAKVLPRDYYQRLNGEQYTILQRESINNAWAKSGPGRSPSDPNSIRPPQYQVPDYLQQWNGISTEWQDEIFRKAWLRNYDLNVSGGTDQAKYFFSGGYSGNDGVLIGSGFYKYTAQIKVDVNLADNKVQLGMNLLPSYTKRRSAQYRGSSIFESAIAAALAMPPIVPVYNEDGSYADAFTFLNPGQAGFSQIPNPVQVATELYDWSFSQSTIANSYLKFIPVKNIEFRTTLGGTVSASRNDYFHPSTMPGFMQPAPVIPYGSSTKSNSYNWLSETTISYNGNLGKDHRLNLLVGFTGQKDHFNSNYIRSGNFPNDLVRTLNAGVVEYGESFETEWSLLSRIGRLNYSFMDKILLTATYRADGSSRFGPSTKWGSFPSAAVAYVVSNEKFLVDNPVISFLKVRTSYGLTGNNNIGNYAHVGVLGFTNQTFGSGDGVNSTGMYPSSAPNPSLKWEKAKQLDIGADIGLIKDRIYLTFDWYRRITSDLLLNVPVPTTTGFSSVLTNIGEVENKGLEITLTTRNIQTKNLNWTTTFNFAHNRNKVLRLGPNGDPIYNFSGARITAVGGPIGASRGLKQIGVLLQKDIDAGVAIFPGQIAGDARYLDVNGDGVISNFNGEDGVMIGDSNPKYTFGFNSRLTWKDFDISILANGITGGKTMDLTLQIYNGVTDGEQLKGGAYVSDDEPGDGWTPRIGSVDGQPSTRMVFPTDFFRIRNINLGYQIPIGSGRYLHGIRVYLSMENLITWTKFKGFNPQATSWGGATDATMGGMIGGGAYPLPRVYVLGFNFTF